MGAYPTRGCSRKSGRNYWDGGGTSEERGASAKKDRAYWGRGDTEEEREAASLAGEKEWIFCDARGPAPGLVGAPGVRVEYLESAGPLAARVLVADANYVIVKEKKEP